jgi:hypothetical protein
MAELLAFEAVQRTIHTGHLAAPLMSRRPLQRRLVHVYSRILRPERSPVICTARALHSAEPRIVRDYLE